MKFRGGSVVESIWEFHGPCEGFVNAAVEFTVDEVCDSSEHDS